MSGLIFFQWRRVLGGSIKGWRRHLRKRSNLKPPFVDYIWKFKIDGMLQSCLIITALWSSSFTTRQPTLREKTCRVMAFIVLATSLAPAVPMMHDIPFCLFIVAQRRLAATEVRWTQDPFVSKNFFNQSMAAAAAAAAGLSVWLSGGKHIVWRHGAAWCGVACPYCCSTWPRAKPACAAAATQLKKKHLRATNFLSVYVYMADVDCWCPRTTSRAKLHCRARCRHRAHRYAPSSAKALPLSWQLKHLLYSTCVSLNIVYTAG